MTTESRAARHLIVAADYHPDMLDEFGDPLGIIGVKARIHELFSDLDGIGVTIKLNSVLRAFGYEFLGELEQYGVLVLVDLKLHDIPNTIEYDARFLLDYGAATAVTIMCEAGIDAMHRFVEVFEGYGGIDALGVTILTTHDEEECQAIYGCSTKAGVLRFARWAQLAGLEGLVCSPKEAEMISQHSELHLRLYTPGVRPAWSQIDGDDQKRVLTPAEAIKAGVHKVIIGRPITQAAENDQGLPQNPREALFQTLGEIEEALGDME